MKHIGWVIKHPDGTYIIWASRETRSETIKRYKEYQDHLKFSNDINWQKLYREGYRCVKVYVKEE